MAAYVNPLSTRFELSFFRELPASPGVYFMRARNGEILYVGKAKSLRARVSSYRNAKPGKVGTNILRLLERVDRIEWERHASEALAAEREREIIRAAVPRYNIAGAWEEEYFFIGLRVRRGKIELRLTDCESKAAEFELHGCYPRRRTAKGAYSALLRLLYACASKQERFRFPAKLARPKPAYDFALCFDDNARWKRLLSNFLHGRRSGLLQAIVEELLENAALPEYVRPGLQRDLEHVRDFASDYRASRKRSQIPSRLVSHEELREGILRSIQLEG